MEYYIIIVLMITAIIVGIYKHNVIENFANYWYCPKDEPFYKFYKNISNVNDKTNVSNVGCSVNTKWGYNFNL